MCYYNSIKITNKDLSRVEWEHDKTEIVREAQSGFEFGTYPIITAHHGKWHLDMAH